MSAPRQLRPSLRSLAATGAVACVLLAAQSRAGVTFITHGLNGNTDGWVTGMADRIPDYPAFPGTNFVCYKLYFSPKAGGGYELNATNLTGSDPLSTDSGEILLKFDWSQLADGNSYDTYEVAQMAVPALLSTNFIPDLGGHALAELPLHLIGHSRGGSLICEMSRLLGTNGIWVDHLTTLDPHPLNNDGFWLDALKYSDVDASAKTYSSVLFHDNCWQHIDLVVYGEAVAGAYVRRLTNLSGGNSLAHSDVHLWYHGTLDPQTPAWDGETFITESERTNWWYNYEQRGARAGFIYSLVGGADRRSADQPLGVGYSAILDGYNQAWDLGAGKSANRTMLSGVTGAWPSLIQLERAETNSVVQGNAVTLHLFYQWAVSSNNLADLQVFLDEDANPWNTNSTWLGQLSLPGSGASTNIGQAAIAVTLSSASVPPGWHRIFARLQANGHSRYLYLPGWIQVIESQPPSLAIAQTDASEFQISIAAAPGQRVVLQSSPDVLSWSSIGTNDLPPGGTWVYTNAPAAPDQLFFRAFSP